MSTGIMERNLNEVEEVRKHFEHARCPTRKQSILLKKNPKLLREGSEDWELFSSSARSRHKAAQKVLRAINADTNLGPAAFYLSAYALSLSALAGAGGFVTAYKKWWEIVAIPEAFFAHVKTLDKRQSTASGSGNLRLPSPAAPNIAGQFTTVQSTSRPGSSSDEQKRTETAHRVFSTSSLAGRQDDYELPYLNEGRQVELQGSIRPDAPIGGSVYALERLDVIRALLDGNPRGKLTIPNVNGLPPFIMFDCSEIMALELLIKGRQMIM